MDPKEITVEVRRYPNDRQTAKYRLCDVEALHWASVSGGIGRATSKPGLAGYVLCNAMVSGEIAHSCRPGPPPHDILVFLPKVVNKDLWSLLIKQVPRESPAPGAWPRGAAVAAAIAPAVEAKRAKAGGVA